MVHDRLWGIVFIVLLLIYVVLELGWGGGDPNDPGHNPPKGGI